MGIDVAYVDVVKRRLNLSDESTRSANCNQDGDRCAIAAPLKPAQKENATVSAPQQPAKEENATITAPMTPPAPPNDEEEGTIKSVPQSNGHDLDINFNKVSLSDKIEFGSLPAEKTCVFPFFLPKLLCGKLIGRNGWSRREIREKTGVDVHVLKEISQVNDDECQLVHLIGPEKTMKKAIQMVRSKFPERKYPQVRLDVARQPIIPREIHLPETQILIQVSCVTNPGLIYVKQPEHWSYCSHGSFQTNMTAHYHENLSPEVKDPLPGDIYVALGPQCHRVTVLEVPNEEEVLVRYLDLGGIFIIPVECLRPIKEEFLAAPFQATECAMAGIYENGPGWSNAAYNYLLSWCHQIIYGVVTYGGSIPCIQLFGKLPNGEIVCINEEMMMMTDIAQVGSGVVVSQEPTLEISPQEEVGGEAAELTVQETVASAEETEAEAPEEGQEVEATETTTEGAETTEVTSEKEEAAEKAELDEGQDPAAVTATTGSPIDV